VAAETLHGALELAWELAWSSGCSGGAGADVILTDARSTICTVVLGKGTECAIPTLAASRNMSNSQCLSRPHTDVVRHALSHPLPADPKLCLHSTHIYAGHAASCRGSNSQSGYAHRPVLPRGICGREYNVGAYTSRIEGGWIALIWIPNLSSRAGYSWPAKRLAWPVHTAHRKQPRAQSACAALPPTEF
jgi:hypothetical protein